MVSVVVLLLKANLLVRRNPAIRDCSGVVDWAATRVVSRDDALAIDGGAAGVVAADVDFRTSLAMVMALSVKLGGAQQGDRKKDDFFHSLFFGFPP